MSDETKKKEEIYRESVFLPKTGFPMRGGLPQKEPEILQKWQDMDLYGQMRARAKGKVKFVLHDGPPYANGNIHMGHAVNKVLKDVVVKSNAMTGKDAPYVPGWDCHGLPIEWKIEEKYRAEGKDKDAVDILEFREECRAFAQGWIETQSAQFQRLGVTGDWANPYRTMTNRAESKIVREIHKFALNGGLYKGAKPVMWSVVEKTALAEAEVEYKEHKSITVWVKFPVVECPNVPELVGANIVIWTTTPWTLPSNRAIAFGEKISYMVIEVTQVADNALAQLGDKICLAEDLIAEVSELAGIDGFSSVGSAFYGDDLAGTVCAHPLRQKRHPEEQSDEGSEVTGKRSFANAQDDSGWIYDFDVPLLAGDFVTDMDGTGFVHVAPGHGEDDFNLIRNYNDDLKYGTGEEQTLDEIFDDSWEEHAIEITDNITDDGKFRPAVPLFAGLEVYTQEGKMGEGNFAVLRELKNAEALLAKGSIKHDYPHSWRSKAPVIFRTTPQWFIAMDGDGKIREKALAAIKETGWHPAKGEARITAMIENRPDWCISRQRAWGVPIALFLHKESGEVLVDAAVFDRIAAAFEEEGADAWWKDGAAQRFLGETYDAADYSQVFDIVDVWFESGSTHAFVLGDTQTWPCFEGVEQADLYLEGSDQHRGWFHSSLLESVGTNGYAPYKNVLTHGFVLDEKGYKMSKSLGNVVDPLKMMDTYGADIIRLWVMLSDYAEDIRIGKDTLKNTGDLYRRIRNTLRFLLGALDGFTEEERVDLSDKRVPELERYMLHLLAEMDDFVRGCIGRYEFGRLAKRLHDFCNSELSAFYFDIRKDRLYCDRPDLFERRACRSVMAEIFSCLSAWLAPILSFTADEAWSHRPEGAFDGAESVHLLEFPKVPESWRDAALMEKWKSVKSVRAKVLADLEEMRESGEIKSSLEARIVFKVDNDQYKSGDFEGVNIDDVCIVSSFAFEPVKAPASGNVKVIAGPSVKKAEGHKCARCWKVLPEVSEATLLCNRCADAVKAHEKTSKAA